MDFQGEIRRRSRRRQLLAARRYRSRRFWQSISRRRKTIGMLALLFLVGVLYAAYYYTRPRRVERLAEEYLTRLTGRVVKIRDARFSPFEGIRLQEVRVLPPADPEIGYEPQEKDAIFTAEEVLLELEPKSLLAGRLRVRRIVAVKPEVIQTRRLEEGEPTYARQNLPTGGWDITLPVIELRQGRYVQRSQVVGQPEPIELFEAAVNVELRPDPAAPDLYRLSGRAAGRADVELIPISGTVTMNPFRITVNELVVSSIRQLPRQIGDMLKRHRIDTAKIRARSDFDSQAGQLVVQFDCRGTQMVLPLDGAAEAEGGEGGASAEATAAAPGPRTGAEPISLELTEVWGLITLNVRNTLPEEGGGGDAGGGTVGQIRFGDEKNPLQGNVSGQPFRLKGIYEGFAADSPFDLHLTSPALVLPQDPAVIGRLPRLVRKIWDSYEPSGTVGLEARLRRLRPGEGIQVTGSVECRDVAATYWCYPFPLEHVAGTIGFDNRQTRLALSSRQSGSTITIEGTVGLTAHRPLDLRVTGKAVAVDEKVLAALRVKHAEYVPVIRDLNVSDGTIDFDCQVRRADRPDARVENQLTMGFNRLALVPKQFNYPLRVMKGRGEFIGNGLRLHDLEVMPAHIAEADTSALLLVDGLVRKGESGGAEVRLDVVSASLPLDETLWNAFPETVARTLAEYHIDARGRLVGRIHKRPGEPLDFDVRGQLNGGYLKFDGFPYALRSLTGQVHITPRSVKLIDTQGEHHSVPISVVGQIAVSSDEPTTLSIRTDRIPLDKDLFEALPPAAKANWKSLSPTGWVALDVALDQGPARAEKGRPPMTTVVSITALGNGVCYEGFPYPLRQMTGQVVIRPDRVDLINLVDGRQGRQVRLSGTIWPSRDNMNLPRGRKPQPKFDLKLSAEGVAFDETLRRAVPWQIRQRWNEILPTGQFDLSLDPLRYTPLGETSRWDFGGRMDIHNGRGLLGFQLDRVNGQIVGRGALIIGQTAAFVGKVALSEVTVAGKPMTDVTGQLVHDARTGQLRIDELMGRIYDGRVSGFAQIGLTDRDLPYVITLAGRDIDLNQLVNTNRAPQERWEVSGRLDGQVAVEGRLSTGRRRGRGEVLLSRAEIYQLPPVLPMITASRVQRGGRASQSANVRFSLADRRVVLEEANLRDPSILLLGTGTMDWPKKELDMTFVAGQPSAGGDAGPRLLEELISGASEELMRYRLTGPIQKPKVEAVPLHTVRDAIEELTRARRRYQAGQKRPAPGPPGVTPTGGAPAGPESQGERR